MTAADYQLVVVGAGPAGMAAAVSAAARGLRVAVFDQQNTAGGQIYRGLAASPSAARLGGDYLYGQRLLRAFAAADLDYYPASRVWHLEPGAVGIVADGRSREVSAAAILIAVGAQERPMPFPGWQLPGIMTAGAAQVLLKSAALAPARPPVLAGSGPLLWLLAWQYLRAGIEIGALIDTTPRDNRRRALPRLARALAGADYLFKGAGMIVSLRRARVPVFSQASRLVASGGERLRELEFDCGGTRRRLETELLLLHQGVVPALQMADAAGCAIDWNAAQQCWQVRCDAWGETSRAGIFVAGDGAAIGGARVAELSGGLAALQLACQLGHIDRRQRDARARPLLRARARHLAIRPWLDAYYRVADEFLLPDDDTLVCRCEEVSAAELRAVAAEGCPGPNQAKAFTRCGMGPCQGRFCGATVEQIFARARGRGVDQIGRYRVRPPLQPITLGQLAAGDGVD